MRIIIIIKICLETFRRHHQALVYLEIMQGLVIHNKQHQQLTYSDKYQHKHSEHQLQVICLGKLLLNSKWVKARWVHNLLRSDQPLSLNQFKPKV